MRFEGSDSGLQMMRAGQDESKKTKKLQKRLHMKLVK